MKFFVSRSVLHNRPVQSVCGVPATPAMRSWGSEVKPIRQADASAPFYWTGERETPRDLLNISLIMGKLSFTD